MESKGQTALEYLLIIVVILLVIIAIFLWSQSASQAIGDAGQGHTSPSICATYRCTACGAYTCPASLDECPKEYCGNDPDCLPDGRCAVTSD